MQSIRKIVCKPRVDDWAPLSKFYHADEALNAVAAELDSFDGRRDPERCNQLVNKLRQCQDRVLQIIEEILTAVFPSESERAPRDFRVKFPDDILHENLPGQLWFGAECLSAGSNIIDHEFESEAIRPLARSLTRHLDKLRELLKDQGLRNPGTYPDKLKKSLRIFDYLFAEFELNYVSAMVPVKSCKEYDAQLDVAVLFSETLVRAIKLGYLTQEQIDDCEPSVMITLPRLAIVCGLLTYPDGPLNVDQSLDAIPEMFRPFQTLLKKIRDLLRILREEELVTLERTLCNQDDVPLDRTVTLISDYRTQPKCGEKERGDRAEERELSSPDSEGGEEEVPQLSLAVGSPLGDVIPSPDLRAEEPSLGGREPGGRREADAVSENSEETTSWDSASGPEAGEEETDVRIRVEQPGTAAEEEPASSSPDVEITYSALERLPESVANADKQKRGDGPSKSKNGRAPLDEQERFDRHRRAVRARFRSSEDLVHRLFVCIAGVADQLQTNYPSDLRGVLKMVLQPAETVVDVFEVDGRTAQSGGSEEEVGVEVGEGLPTPTFAGILYLHASFAPVCGARASVGCVAGVRWVPDSECSSCSGCAAPFTLVRRRHHCRNCGHIFCYRCSANSAPIPALGYAQAVRVCNKCVLYKLDPFTGAAPPGPPDGNATDPRTPPGPSPAAS